MFDVTQNPFVYGEVVPAAAFVDRVAELDRLVADLTAAQKVFLISPRRYGKSSLIRRALAAVSRTGALTVEVTVSSFSSYVAFLEGYARALVAAETKWDRARTWLREAARLAAPRCAPPRGGPRRSARSSCRFPASADRDTSRLARRTFALPARLAERAAARWWWRSTSSRPSRFNGGRSSTRCARQSSISARTTTSSPDRSPA